MGGTMRLGADPVKLHDGTRAREIFGEAVIYKRHRHRYEVNNMLRRRLEDEGLVCSRHLARRAPGRDHRAARPPVLRRLAVSPRVQLAPDPPRAAVPRVRRRGRAARRRARRRPGDRGDRGRARARTPRASGSSARAERSHSLRPGERGRRATHSRPLAALERRRATARRSGHRPGDRDPLRRSRARSSPVSRGCAGGWPRSTSSSSRGRSRSKSCTSPAPTATSVADWCGHAAATAASTSSSQSSGGSSSETAAFCDSRTRWSAARRAQT